MRRFARFVLAAAGAAILILIAPRTNPWSMRWLPIDPDTSSLRWFGGAPAVSVVWVLAVAAALCLAPWVVARARRESAPDRRESVVLLACAAVLVFSLVPVGLRGRGVVVNLMLGSAGITLLVCGIAGAPLGRRLEAFGRGVIRCLRGLPSIALVLTAFLIVFVAANLGSYLLLGHVPHVVDSADQLFHARILLEGRLSAPPPVPEASFRFTHMITGERWYSQYPPGHTLLLALGLLLQAPWLINPLLGALSVVLLYFVGRDAYSEGTGRWAALLCALSPFVWLMSSSYMSHGTAMFFLALFLFGFVRAMQTGSGWAAGLWGFAAGFALTARPLTAVAFVAPFALYGAVESLRRFVAGTDGDRLRRLAKLWAPAIAGFALPLAGLLLFNRMTNGDPLLFGYEVAHGAEALPGFGKAGWSDIPHTPWRGLRATLNNLNALNQYLFGLPLPSLALPLLGFAMLRRTVWDWLLAASVVSLIAAHFFYWYQDLAYGPRFLYSAVVPLVLLAARSLTALPSFLERRFPGRPVTGAVGIALLLALAYGFTVNVPALASFYSRNYYDVNPRVTQAVLAAGLSRAVVLVPHFHYPGVFPLNEPLLDGDVVYARDRDAETNRELARRFPSHEFYRLRAYETYVLEAFDPLAEQTAVAHAVEATGPFELEGLASQVAYLSGGTARDLGMGKLGPGWKNHDQLWAQAAYPGMELGFVLVSDRDASKTMTLRLTRTPDSGVIEVRMNGGVLRSDVDLYAAHVDVVDVRIENVPLRAGRNGLMLRVVERNPAANGASLGLDWIRLE